MTGKAAFDAWDALITKVSDIAADFERQSDIINFVYTSKHKPGVSYQKVSLLSLGMTLEDACRHLDQKMVELEEIQRCMMHAGRGLRNSLVPANNLPPEVLSYIFLLGVEQAEHGLDMAASRSKKRRSPRAIPFTLPVSQVCRRWRKIAINAATLWSHIGFSDDRPHSLSQLFLPRSKGALLDVKLTSTDIYDSEYEANMKEGMDILSEHVSRVGSLTIDAATDTQLGLLATFLESCEAQWIARGQTQPTLRRLKLIDSADSDYDSGSDSDSDSEDIITPNINQKRLSPNNLQTLRGLEDVVLSGTSLPWHSPVFEGLKRLSLENLQNEVLPSEREFISIIRNCPLLEELELANAGLRLEKWEGIAEMRRRTHSSDLNRLESLCLFQLPWNVMMFILHLVNSPNLKSLWIALPTAIRDQDSIVDHDEEIFRDVHLLKSIAAFIDRISEKSALRTLHIGSFYGTSVWDDGKHTNPHLMEVLRAVPSCLHTLELYHIVVGDDVLESLSAIAPTPSAPSNPHTGAHSVSASISSILHPKIIPICPSLQVLKLLRIADVTAEDLEKLLAIRKKWGVPLTLEIGLPMSGFSRERGEFEALEPLCRSLSIREVL